MPLPCRDKDSCLCLGGVVLVLKNIIKIFKEMEMARRTSATNTGTHRLSEDITPTESVKIFSHGAFQVVVVEGWSLCMKRQSGVLSTEKEGHRGATLGVAFAGGRLQAV